MGTTYASYLAAGRGAVAYRLVIEGCPVEFVTDEAMERTLSDGRIVARGLSYQGISVGEVVDMASAELNVTISSLQISETPGQYRDSATRAFSAWTSGAVLTYLAPGSSVTAGATTAQVRSSLGLSVGQYVHVGTECWLVTAIAPSGTTAPSTITITRAQRDSFAQAFPANATSASGAVPSLFEVTSEPATYKGRRVWLYGHGTSELNVASSPGTVVFRGVLAENPELSDSRTWSLSMQPRTVLLDANIGQAGGGDIGLRGIYYPGRAPLTVIIRGFAGAARTSAPGTAYTIRFVGFYETQAEFCSALQARIAAAGILAVYGTFTVTETVDGVWRINVTTDGADPRYVTISQGSAIDGWMRGDLANSDGVDAVMSVAASKEYYAPFVASGGGGFAGNLPLDYARKTPRANYHIDGPYRGSDANVASWPHTRFYLSVVSGFTSGTMTLTPPRVRSGDPDPTPLQLTVSTVSALGFVQVADSDAWMIDSVNTGGLSGFACASTVQPTITIATRYGAAIGCNLAAFMTAVLAESPNSCNLGSVPWLVSDDVADWTSEVLAASGGHSWLELRDYVFTKPRKLREILLEELKLYGLFMCLDSAGRIAVRRYPQDLSTSVATINSSVHLPDDDFGTQRASYDGVITSVSLKLGYSVADDKWATTWDFTRVNGAATAKNKTRTISISPYVRASGGASATDRMTPADADFTVSRLLGWFGSQYFVVTVPVAITMHTLRLGDSVLVTIAQLPHAGKRGSTLAGTGYYQTRATVVGRHWDYGDSPSGTLDLFVHALDIAGYAPSAQVASASGAGVSWAFTCTTSKYGPVAVADASYFAAGYKVILREFDASPAQRYTGTVASVVGNVVTITFDASFPGLGSRSWIIGFGAAQIVTTAQRIYAFLADPAGRIQYSDQTSPARLFS